MRRDTAQLRGLPDGGYQQAQDRTTACRFFRTRRSPNDRPESAFHVLPERRVEFRQSLQQEVPTGTSRPVTEYCNRGGGEVTASTEHSASHENPAIMGAHSPGMRTHGPYPARLPRTHCYWTDPTTRCRQKPTASVPMPNPLIAPLR